MLNGVIQSVESSYPFYYTENGKPAYCIVGYTTIFSATCSAYFCKIKQMLMFSEHLHTNVEHTANNNTIKLFSQYFEHILNASFNSTITFTNIKSFYKDLLSLKHEVLYTC